MRLRALHLALGLIAFCPATTSAEGSREHCDVSIGFIGINGCNRLLRIDPTNAPAYVNRGRKWLIRGAHFSAHRRREQLDRALADFDTAFALDPNSADAQVGRGDTLRLLGDRSAALAAYTGAIQLDSTLGPYNHLAMGEYEQPLQVYIGLLEVEPRNAFAYSGRAVVYGAKGDFQQAFADHRRAIEINPGAPRIFANRGYTSRAKGDYSTAIADYTTAIEMSPMPAEYLAERAQTHLLQGALSQALSDAEAARRLLPYDAHVLTTLGRILAAVGRDKEAIAIYRLAMARSHETEEVRRALRRLGYFKD
jgi:tetratricopeptide (TPR) repeat protein